MAGLIEKASAHPVTVVRARAGSGKTMACATWAVAAARPRRVAWLTLDEGDRSPARFWANVTTALAADAIPVEPSLVPRSRDGVDDLPASVLSAVRGVASPTVLVLDNMHELAGGGVLPELSFLLRHAPATLRVILSGRYMPGLQLTRMRLAGDLAEITEADLACTPDEADAILAALGVAADEAERDALLRHTDGWMAGLRMAALAAQATQATQATQADRAGWPGEAIGFGGAVVADYLHDEVLDRQSAQVQLFLRRTSVAKRLTGELADQLTGEPGGALVLDRLHRQNSFVDRDSDGQYRYHPCLRATLLAELRQWLAPEVPALFSRAARWHAASDEAVEAVSCAAEAQDWGFASHALAEVGIAALLPDRAAELEEVLAGFPAERRTDDPVIAAALAAARLCDGDPECAAVYLDCAQRAIDDGEPAPVIELWLAALRVMRSACSRDADPGTLAACQEQAEKAQASARTVQAHQALGLLWLVLGTAWLGRWELADARSALARAEHQLTAANLTTLRTRTRGWRALTEAFYGDLSAAAELVGLVRASVPSDPAGECLATLAAGWLALERDDLDAARQSLDNAATGAAFRRLPLPGEPDAEALRTMIKASVALAAGDAAAARGLVTLGRGADSDLAALSALDADIALRTGDIARAAAFAAPERQPRSVVRMLARARVLLAAGDSAGALAEASACLDGSEGSPATLRDQITALLTAAAASRRMGAADATAELLERALLLAEPHEAYRPFLDAGSGIHSAIAVLVPSTSPVASFAARVIERFVCQLPVASREPGAPESVPLTPSEVAVLRLLPSYLTNQEIAEQLFLSVNTVKTHLRSAYHKLGVTSRREAIARGRRLRLL